MDRKQIGTCGVDAGCLIIIDPCYLKYLPPTKSDEDWLKFCKDVLGPTALSSKSAGQISYGGGGVIVSSGHGDGVYPVYAHYDEDGCITKVEIVFMQDEESRRLNGMDERLCKKDPCNPETCKAVVGECQHFDNLRFTDYEEHPDRFELYPEELPYYETWKRKKQNG